jgi:hypothetical protein
MIHRFNRRERSRLVSPTGRRPWDRGRPNTPRLALALGCIATALSGGCSGEDDRPPFEPGRKAYDVSPIDITRFATDPAVRRRVLHMPFGEAAERLGSLRFHAESDFDFTRGGDTYEQRDVYGVRQDPSGNFHVHLVTPVSEVEFALVGEDVYVRHDRGKLRMKPRREVDTETWTELAFSSVHQSLDLFRPRLAFVDPQPDEIAGRAATRVRLALAEGPTAEAARPATSILPVGPPARWRELATPLDLSGTLWLDTATGVVLRVELKGRVEVADREVRPTQLTVSYRATVSEIGEVTEIPVGEAIDEYRRTVPPRDDLAFFRDLLPPPEAKTP